MKLVDQLTADLEAAKNAANASQMKAYMKDRFEFFGVKSPERKKILSLCVQQNGKPSFQQGEEFARLLWNAPERELHYCCQEVLKRMKFHQNESSIQLFQWMITHQSWWDTVDFISSNLVGNYFLEFPENKKRFLPQWNSSSNMWLVRATIIFQLKYKQATDFDLLCAMIIPHLGSKEFFLQKAIGWALREYAKTNAVAVKQFVEAENLAPLSQREALKHFQ